MKIAMDSYERFVQSVLGASQEICFNEMSLAILARNQIKAYL